MRLRSQVRRIGHPGEVVREKCSRVGVRVRRRSAPALEGIPYAAAAGAGILRTSMEVSRQKRWVDMAGEHGICEAVITSISTIISQAEPPGLGGRSIEPEPNIGCSNSKRQDLSATMARRAC